MKRDRDIHASRVLSASADETEQIGRALARDLAVPGIVLLRGALGSGKTTLVRGLAMGLGLEDPAVVHSPSFALVHLYPGRCPIYHVDLYRLSSEREVRSIGLEEFMGREGITIVEWAERLPYPVRAEMEIDMEDAGADRRLLVVVRHSAGRPNPAGDGKRVSPRR